MHFNSISVLSAAPSALAEQVMVARPSGVAAAAAPTKQAEAAAVVAAVAAAVPPAPSEITPQAAQNNGRDALVEASQNLLKHIPGEASGFYLLAVDSINNPSVRDLGLIFTLALVLLVVVRWLAKASWGIMTTTIVAFALWMLIFEKGFLHVLLPNLLPAPMGLIVAVFYSMLITLLASAGKIR